MLLNFKKCRYSLILQNEKYTLCTVCKQSFSHQKLLLSVFDNFQKENFRKIKYFAKIASASREKKKSTGRAVASCHLQLQPTTIHTMLSQLQFSNRTTENLHLASFSNIVPLVWKELRVFLKRIFFLVLRLQNRIKVNRVISSTFLFNA